MFDHLKALDLAGMTQINPKKQGVAVNAAVGLSDDQLLRHKYAKHEQAHLIRNRKAVDLLQRLPEAGEVFSVLMSGSFDGWDYVQAVLDLAAPATIDELYVATLGFGDDNASRLLHQLDAGAINRVWFVASCYMRDSKHGDKFAKLSKMLTQRGHHISATRNHAKILAMKLTDGRTVSVDGSINLCSCKNVEQAHVWGDPDLFDFYAGYIRSQAESTTRVK